MQALGSHPISAPHSTKILPQMTAPVSPAPGHCRRSRKEELSPCILPEPSTIILRCSTICPKALCPCAFPVHPNTPCTPSSAGSVEWCWGSPGDNAHGPRRDLPKSGIWDHTLPHAAETRLLPRRLPFPSHCYKNKGTDKLRFMECQKSCFSPLLNFLFFPPPAAIV